MSDVEKAMEVVVLLVFAIGIVAWPIIITSVFLKLSYRRELEAETFKGLYLEYKEYRKFGFAKGTRLMYYKLRSHEFIIAYAPLLFLLFLILTLPRLASS